MEVYKKSSSIFKWLNGDCIQQKSTYPSMSVWRDSVMFWWNNSWTFFISDIIFDRSFGKQQRHYFDHEKELWYWTMWIGMLMPIVYTSPEPSSLKVLISKPNPSYPSMESWLILTSEPITSVVKLISKDSSFQNYINCKNCIRRSCMLERIWCLVVNEQVTTVFESESM